MEPTIWLILLQKTITKKRKSKKRKAKQISYFVEILPERCSNGILSMGMQ